MGRPETVDPVDAEALRAAVRAALGVAVARLEPISPGLGYRRFVRVHLEPPRPAPTLVARIEGELPADRAAAEPPLEPLRAWLERSGLPVGCRYGGDSAHGIELLEDLGTVSLGAFVARAPADERRALYREACDWVVRLQALEPVALPAFERHLDAELLRRKAHRFVEASLPAGLGRSPTAAERACVGDAFETLIEALADAPRRLAHRDYQSSNLLVRDGAEGHRLAWVDVQGAFLAPPEYDLVCLLRDSYVALADDEVQALGERTRARLPDAPDADAFARRFDLLTLARKAKDHALFHEVAARGDRGWLRFAETTRSYLVQAARRLANEEPRFGALAALLAELRAPEDPCAR